VTTTGGREGVLVDGGSTYIEILDSELYCASAMFDRDNPHCDQVSQLYGLQACGDSSHIRIENNYAHDIQSSGFVFFGVSNLVVRGNNADWLASDGFKFSNITFEDNVIYTGHTRGNSVTCPTCVARNNTVLAAEQDGEYLVHKQVTIHDVGTQEDNVTSTYLAASGINGTNHALQYEDAGSPLFYNDYYVNAKAGPGLTIDDLRPVVGSPADGEVGAYERIYELLGGGP
jgi:hypothetical protein